MGGTKKKEIKKQMIINRDCLVADSEEEAKVTTQGPNLKDASERRVSSDDSAL